MDVLYPLSRCQALLDLRGQIEPPPSEKADRLRKLSQRFTLLLETQSTLRGLHNFSQKTEDFRICPPEVRARMNGPKGIRAMKMSPKVWGRGFL